MTLEAAVWRRAKGAVVRCARYGREHKLVVAGVVILAFFVVLALLAPVIAPGNPQAMDGPIMTPPSARHWLGTTAGGQDVWHQLVWGARVSLSVGLIAGVLATAIAVLIGVGGAFVGGATDDGAVMLANIFLIIPGIPLMVVLGSYLASEGQATVIAVIAITGWPWAARVLRAQTLALRRRDFVRLARIGGERTLGLIWHEILPNMLSLVAVMQLNAIVYAIVAQASLQFLGLGDVNSTSWGTMLYWANNYQALLSGAWWWVLPPGLCIALVGAALAMINRGVDEISNPQLRGPRRARKVAADA